MSDIAALTSRAEAAEAQVAALRKAAEKFAAVPAWFERMQEMDRLIIFDGCCRASSSGAYGVYKLELEDFNRIKQALSSLPASPATEKLQARVKELEGALTDARDVIIGPTNWRGMLADQAEVKRDVLASIDKILPRRRTQAASALKGDNNGS